MLQNIDSLIFTPAVAQAPPALSVVSTPSAPSAPNVLDLEKHLDAEDAAFDKAMCELRRHYAGHSAGKQMSFALKQRSVELPMVEYAVSFSRSSTARRQVVVRRLVENVEKGPGHLTVNRAKQALKEIGSAVGCKQLIAELSASETRYRWQAAQLLGWLKDSKAVNPLIDAYINGDQELRLAIDEILRRHFASQFSFFAQRRIASAPALNAILLPLTQ